MEKIPLFALAALSCIVTFIAQQKVGAVESIAAFPLRVRIANAFVSYIRYVAKMIWPANLAVFYPHPGLWHFWQVLGAVVLLGAVTFAVIRTAKGFPYLAVGWLWFAGTLVPVIGIVQVGRQALADRYTYVPLIGLFIMAAWGIPELLKKWRLTRPSHKKVLFASSALIVPCLAILTWTQVGYWRDSISLFDHTLKLTSHNYVIYCDRGAAYGKLGNLRQAIEDLNKALEINPKYADAYHNRGTAYGKLGNVRQAIEDFDRVVKIDPEYAAAYHNRGIIYDKLGDLRQAAEDMKTAARLDDEDAKNYLRSHGVNWQPEF